jgi:hypothetical protein
LPPFLPRRQIVASAVIPATSPPFRFASRFRNVLSLGQSNISAHESCVAFAEQIAISPVLNS